MNMAKITIFGLINPIYLDNLMD